MSHADLHAEFWNFHVLDVNGWGPVDCSIIDCIQYPAWFHPKQDYEMWNNAEKYEQIQIQFVSFEGNYDIWGIIYELNVDCTQRTVY